MTRVRRLARAAAPALPIVLLLVLAAVAALVAREARAIDRAVVESDVEFVGRPTDSRLRDSRPLFPTAERRWKVHGSVPYVDRLLGIEDDLVYRRGLRAFEEDWDRRNIGLDYFRPAFRAEARRFLRAAERSDLPASLRANAANLLGVLALEESQTGSESGGSDNPARRRKLTADSVAAFRRALRIDRHNEDAKFNLEFVLRLPPPPPPLAEPFEDVARLAPGRSLPGGGTRRRGFGY